MLLSCRLTSNWMRSRAIEWPMPRQAFVRSWEPSVPAISTRLTDALQVAVEMHSDATVQLHHRLVVRALDAHLLYQISCKVLVQNCQDALLGRNVVGFQEFLHERWDGALQKPSNRLVGDLVARKGAESLVFNRTVREVRPSARICPGFVWPSVSEEG